MNPKPKPDIKAFRAALTKALPGYQWTVHKWDGPGYDLKATGIRTSGFNRCSTISVDMKERLARTVYECRIAGYGLRAPWLQTASGTTVPLAIRHLQDKLENQAEVYRGQAVGLESARRTTLPATPRAS